MVSLLVGGTCSWKKNPDTKGTACRDVFSEGKACSSASLGGAEGAGTAGGVARELFTV